MKKIDVSWLMSIICFIMPCTFTALMMSTQGYELYAQVLYVMYALPLEVGKYHFSRIVFDDAAQKSFRVCCFFLALALFGFSIVAGLIFNLNQSNKRQNILSKQNMQYTTAVEQKQNAEKAFIEAKSKNDASIKQLETEIQEMKTSQQKEISSMEQVRDSYIQQSNKNKQQQEINTRNSYWTENINKKSQELQVLRSKTFEVPKLEEVSKPVIKEKSTVGVSSLFGENQEIYWLGLQIVMELTGIAFYIDSGKRKRKKQGSSDIGEVSSTNNGEVTSEVGRLIGEVKIGEVIGEVKQRRSKIGELNGEVKQVGEVKNGEVIGEVETVDTTSTANIGEVIGEVKFSDIGEVKSARLENRRGKIGEVKNGEVIQIGEAKNRRGKIGEVRNTNIEQEEINKYLEYINNNKTKRGGFPSPDVVAPLLNISRSRAREISKLLQIAK